MRLVTGRPVRWQCLSAVVQEHMQFCRLHENSKNKDSDREAIKSAQAKWRSWLTECPNVNRLADHDGSEEAAVAVGETVILLISPPRHYCNAY